MKNIEIEKTVLGTILMFPNSIYEIYDKITVNSFTSQANQRIWEGISKLFLEGTKIDELSLIEELRPNLDMVGGAHYIASLNVNIVTDSQILKHVLLLKQLEISREQIKFAEELKEKAKSGDSLEVNAYMVDESFRIAAMENMTKSQNATDILLETTKYIEEGKKGLTGVDCGYRNLNDLFGGWQCSDFIIIAARPSVGKTAFGLNMLSNMINKHVAFFSLEMSNKQLFKRLISINVGVKGEDLNRGRVSTEEWKSINSCKLLSSEYLHVFDDVYTLSGIITTAKKLKAQGKLDIIMIDYLQLIKHSLKNRNRENEVSEISRALKILAKTLDVPLIAFSQLSRNLESRANKRPLLSDLRESGSLEQDADVVCFLFRPEIYEMYEDSRGNDTHGKCYLLVSKHRNGELRDIEFDFIAELTKFEEPDDIF